MPAKPAWYSKINEIVRDLEALPRPFVDRATVEFLLGVGRRRAQQILSPCICDRIGANGLADRDTFIAHLRGLTQSEVASYERQRRRKVATILGQLKKQRLAQPQVLIEAPVHVLTQKLATLPEGVRLEPGRIIISFDGPQQALEKLLALAMAIGNDFGHFEREVQPREHRE